MVVLDTIEIAEDRLIDKIEHISTAELLAEAIIRIHENVLCHLCLRQVVLNRYEKSQMTLLFTFIFKMYYNSFICFEVAEWIY